jgi:hypothetical protein
MHVNKARQSKILKSVATINWCGLRKKNSNWIGY